ncbi:hypothetical protein ALC57_16103 [Trachymyrmex cornetzi]|uniref:Uncharacterized protein n=1 Tax=Trachymyrmex cornetzi TaxID=471704 RepID=A0A151IVI8_9HYME|nr:hypothetical protein ALC57_16103 [Trachymyrmex cornetzi]
MKISSASVAWQTARALVYHARGPGLNIPVGIEIFTLVSPLGKDRQPPKSILAHRNTRNQRKHLWKNPPFGTGIKTVGPICLWQLNNQRVHHKHTKEV